MENEDDEILQGFIEESLEHLADIENDLLAIEEAGANIDEDLVNKVFRAAHSIKGGAGFMGLTAIQGLSHSTENVLGMIRSKKLIPTPEIVNVLLMASDQLQKMIEDVNNSNEVDISSHVNPLDAIGSHFDQSMRFVLCNQNVRIWVYVGSHHRSCFHRPLHVTRHNCIYSIQ